MRCSLKPEAARVQTPGYARDNVPVSLLARAHAAFVAASPEPGATRRLTPSFYPESQGSFAEGVKREVAVRLGLACALQFVEQTEFPAPPVRINTDLCDPVALGWEKSAAWDGFVGYLRAKPETHHSSLWYPDLECN